MTDAAGARRAELAVVERSSAAARTDRHAWIVLVDGEAGIGKSHLLDAAVEAARTRGDLVVRAGLTEAEAGLSWAGLAVLVRQFDPELVTSLPPAHRHTLSRVAGDLAEGSITAEAVAFAFTALLAASTEDRCTVVVVDDLQWFDTASAGVLAFALRSNSSSALVVIAARRSGLPVPVDLGGITDVTADRMTLAGLSLAGIFDVLAAHGYAPLARPDLVRIHELSRGNPLLAIELARARVAGCSLAALDEIDILSSVARTVFDGAGDTLVDAALITALMARPTVRDVRAIVGSEADEALARLERLGVIESDGSVLRYTHPLRREAVVERAGALARARAHRRIARVTDDPDQRVFHLSEIAEGPDATLAEELERTADEMANLGVDDVAARRFRRAADLTPDDAPRDRWRREHRAVTAAMALGEHEAVLTDAERLYREAATTAEVAASGFALSRARRLVEGIDAAAETIRDALSRLESDPVHREQLMEWLVRFDQFRDAPRAAATARASLERALADGDARVVERARTVVACAQVLAGEAIDVDGLLPPDVDIPLSIDQVPFTVETLVWTNRVDRAIRALEPVVEDARAGHRLMDLLLWLSQLGDAYLRAGRWDDAERCLAEVAGLQGPGGLSFGAQVDLAWLRAARGDDESARGLVERNRSAMPAPPDLDRIQHLARAGFVELCAGRWAEAVTVLTLARREADEIGMVDAASLPFGHDLVESLLAVGDHASAGREAARFASAAERADAPLGIALGLRARALVAGALGRQDEAVELVSLAIRRHDDAAAVVFETARTHLAAGSILRRAGRRVDARAELQAARSTFSSLRAESFVARTDAELARLATRRAPMGLTATEQRVAELARAGMTNTEIAAALSVSVRTVESNLTRVYRKLGVRSRTELAARAVHDAG